MRGSAALSCGRPRWACRYHMPRGDPAGKATDRRTRCHFMIA
jgi:hypothetical protein